MTVQVFLAIQCGYAPDKSHTTNNKTGILGLNKTKIDKKLFAVFNYVCKYSKPRVAPVLLKKGKVVKNCLTPFMDMDDPHNNF